MPTRVERRERVEALLRAGYAHEEIARRTGISQSAVSLHARTRGIGRLTVRVTRDKRGRVIIEGASGTDPDALERRLLSSFAQSRIEVQS